jgi:hypothetical protein
MFSKKRIIVEATEVRHRIYSLLTCTILFETCFDMVNNPRSTRKYNSRLRTVILIYVRRLAVQQYFCICYRRKLLRGQCNMCEVAKDAFEKHRTTEVYTLSSFCWICLYITSMGSRVSSVGIKMGYGLDGRDSIPSRSKFFLTPQLRDRLWCPPRLLHNGYRGLFRRG